MSYGDKLKKELQLRKSLTELLIFAYAPPILPKQERRAIVESIRLGGSLANKHYKDSLQTPNALNYQYTRQGLLRACFEKMVCCPETAKQLRKSICKISALSAWATSNSDRTSKIFEEFSAEMCPEDVIQNPGLPVTNIITRNFSKQLKEQFGEAYTIETPLDFITLSANYFYKKYPNKKAITR